MNSNSSTFRIIKRKPSFVNGASSIIGFFIDAREKYNFDNTEKEADQNSIYADWKAVGIDMKEAINQYERERGFTKRA